MRTAIVSCRIASSSATWASLLLPLPAGTRPTHRQTIFFVRSCLSSPSCGRVVSKLRAGIGRGGLAFLLLSRFEEEPPV